MSVFVFNITYINIYISVLIIFLFIVMTVLLEHFTKSDYSLTSIYDSVNRGLTLVRLILLLFIKILFFSIFFP